MNTKTTRITQSQIDEQLALCGRICDAVMNTYGVALEREVELLGVEA